MKIRSKMILAFSIIAVTISSLGILLPYELALLENPLKEMPSSIIDVKNTSELDGLAQFIRYYDEVLTQSARNYAFTQDKRWEERYKTVEPELDKIIKKAISMGDEVDKQFFSKVNQANMKLVEIEYESINLVNIGKKEEAIKLLESAAYWDEKKIYEQGLREYVERRGSAYDEALVTHIQKLDQLTNNAQTTLTRSVELFFIIIPIVLLVSIGSLMIILRNISKPINDLKTAADKLTNGEYGIQIKSYGNDELSMLTNSFNLMSESLRKSSALLSSTEQKYKNLYEGSPILLRTINLDGIVINCNEHYANQLGYSKDDIIGRSIFETTAEKSISQMKESFEIWKKTGRVENKEIWLKKKNGIIFPTFISATNLYDEDKLIGSNTVIRDMSDIYYANEKLEKSESKIREQYEELKKVDQIKDEFLAMITHELKTPIVPIKGYIDILLSEQFGPFNEIQKQKLEIIKSSTDALMNIVMDLLDTQKIEFGQLRLSKEKHNVAEIINGVIIKLQPDAESHGITVVADLENISCFCDKNRIEEVLVNLFTNAIDFCPKTDGKIQIKLYMEDSKHAKITVKDNGIGIQKSKIDKIFVKFYQTDTSTTREHGGTGLGLSVCKGLIEGHGGKIWAESEGRDLGATIHIILPLE